MTTLANEILIHAPRQHVWDILTQLELLAAYDPGTNSSVLTGEQSDGVGAERRCEVPGGWFIERVAAWEPPQSLALELVSCSFPVTSLRHDYSLSEADGNTRLSQLMTYELKYGAAGRAMDVVMLRRKWDQGIKAFLGGLKRHVETVQPPKPGA